MSVTYFDFEQLHNLLCKQTSSDERLLNDKQLSLAALKFRSTGRKYKYSEGIESILEEWADSEWFDKIKSDSSFTQTMSLILFRLRWWLNGVDEPLHILQISLCARRAIFLIGTYREIDPSNILSISELRKVNPHSLPPSRGGCSRINLPWLVFSSERIKVFWADYYKFWKGKSWHQTAPGQFDNNALLLEERESRGIDYGIIYDNDGREQIQIPTVINVDGHSYSGKKARSQGEKTAVNNFLIIDGRSYIPALQLLTLLQSIQPSAMTVNQLGSAVIVLLQIYEGLSLQQVFKIGLSAKSNSVVGTVDVNTRQIKRIIGGEWTRQASEIFALGEFTTYLVGEMIPILEEVKNRNIKANLIQEIMRGNAIDEYRKTLITWLGCKKKDIITRAGALHNAMFYHNLITNPIEQVPVANLISQTFNGGERAASAYYGVKHADLQNKLMLMQNNLRRQAGLTQMANCVINNNQQLGSLSEPYAKLISDVVTLSKSGIAAHRQICYIKLLQLLGARNRKNHFVPQHYYSEELEMITLNEKKVSGAKVPRFIPICGLKNLMIQLPKVQINEQILYDGQTWSDYVSKNPSSRRLLRGEFINNHRRSYITWLINQKVGQVPRAALTGQGPTILKSFGIHTLQSPREYYTQMREALNPLFKSVGLDQALTETIQTIDLNIITKTINYKEEECESEELMPEGESYVSVELNQNELEFERQFEVIIRAKKLSSPRMTMLFSLIWELSLPWANLTRGQAYYTLNSFFRRSNGDIYFCVPIKQTDKGGLGLWPIKIAPTSFTDELNQRIKRVLIINSKQLSWRITGKEIINAGTTKQYLRELMPKNQRSDGELYALLQRVTLRRCFRKYSGFAAAAFADLCSQSVPNYVSVYDLMRMIGEKESLYNLLDKRWIFHQVPSHSRLKKVKPAKFIPQKRNRVYHFKNLPNELVKSGHPQVWIKDAFIMFFGYYNQEIPKPDALKLLIKNDICKFRKGIKPEKFLNSFWGGVIEKRKMNPLLAPGQKSSVIEPVDFQKMTRAEKAKELAAFMAYPSASEVFNYINDQRLMGVDTGESKIRREAAFIYGQMWRDGWCTLSKPLRLISRLEMRMVFEKFNQALITQKMPQDTKDEYVILFQLCLITGMRPNEIFNTQLTDLNAGGKEVCIFIPKGKTLNAKRYVHLRPLDKFNDYYDLVTQYLVECIKNRKRPFSRLRQQHQTEITKNVTQRFNLILNDILADISDLTTPESVTVSIYTLRHCSALYRIQDSIDKHYWNGNFYSALAGEADQFGHGHFGVTLGSYLGVGMSLLQFTQPKFGP